MASYAPHRYTATAGQTDFPLTFDYDTENQSTIVVKINGVTKTLTTDYTFATENLIRLTTGANVNDRVFIGRSSDFASRPGEWTDTDPFTARNLNREDDEAFRRDQELLARVGLPRSDDTGQWDGSNPDDATAQLRITNVAQPTADNDVVTLAYLNAYVGGGNSGVSGMHRIQFTGDGETTTFPVITTGDKVTSDGQIQVFMNGALVPPSEYNLNAGGDSVVFLVPPGPDVEGEAMVLTSALTTITDGQITPAKISLAENNLIQGNSSSQGEAVARSALPINVFGAGTADLDVGASGSDSDPSDANNNKVTHLATPTNNADASTKKYVDDKFASVSSFGTVSYASSFTADTNVQAGSGGTEFFGLTIVEDTNPGGAVTWEVRISSDVDFGTYDALGPIRFTTDGSKTHESIAFLVPASYYWKVVATEGSATNQARYSFNYQRGVS